ncbi:MAG: hypothetical protein OEZ08_13310 [Betaproteobacteria bacterium]|nr:hypothetical protein [Betaproteobacteria bacterium]
MQIDAFGKFWPTCELACDIETTMTLKRPKGLGKETLGTLVVLEQQVEKRIAAIEKVTRNWCSKPLERELQLLYRIRQRANAG